MPCRREFGVDDWVDRQSANLRLGAQLTVEPGCYIRPAADVPEAFHNIGVRIEDDALVTLSGCEILTESAPKTIADIGRRCARDANWLDGDALCSIMHI
jgi:Xaa-Pro aminopeptidase